MKASLALIGLITANLNLFANPTPKELKVWKNQVHKINEVQKEQTEELATLHTKQIQDLRALQKEQLDELNRLQAEQIAALKDSQEAQWLHYYRQKQIDWKENDIVVVESDIVNVMTSQNVDKNRIQTLLEQLLERCQVLSLNGKNVRYGVFSIANDKPKLQLGATAQLGSLLNP